MTKRLWSRLHWLLGISAGAVLAVMGVTGATLSFEDDIIAALNPQILRVTPEGAALAPPELARAAQALRPQAALRMLTVYADPRAAAKLMFAPLDPQSRRGEILYIDPYRGTETGTEAQLRGHDLLHWLEDLHRRLAAGDAGRALTGVSTIVLVVLTLSGLYLRWPRQGARQWRRWLAIDFSRRGRAFLWSLHATVGTWLLAFYLLSSLTGLYFAYDWYRDAVHQLAGETPRPRQKMPARLTDASVAPDFSLAWSRFVQAAGPWRQVSLNVPPRTEAPVSISYLAADAPHGRAVSRMEVSAGGAVQKHERYAQQTAGGKLIASMFVLHSGQFFGRAGQILMMLVSAMMPLLFVSGWLMYRRRCTPMAQLQNDQRKPVS